MKWKFGKNTFTKKIDLAVINYKYTCLQTSIFNHPTSDLSLPSSGFLPWMGLNINNRNSAIMLLNINIIIIFADNKLHLL
jgi:hypothetical protein